MTKCSTFVDGPGASFPITLAREAGGQKPVVVRAVETRARTFALNALGCLEKVVAPKISEISRPLGSGMTCSVVSPVLKRALYRANFGG